MSIFRRRNKNNNKTNADAPDPSKAKKWETVGGVAGALTGGALLVTGMVFLPPEILEKLGNSVFPFLPEEYRTLACACLSSCSCCMVVCGLVLVMVMMASAS